MSNSSSNQAQSGGVSTGAVLEFRQVSLLPAGSEQAELRAITLALAPGQLALIRLEAGHEHIPLADLAEGLIAPDAGEVRFQDASWAALGPDDIFQRRAVIGRVFDGPAWISNLTVLENVTLSQRHHTRRPVAEIITEAEALAHMFGLASLPISRPAGLARRDLRRAEWVRAFLGQPQMLLLERPDLGVAAEHISLLTPAVQKARERGAAVLWTTDEDRVWNNPDLSVTLRWRMQGPELVEEGA